METRFSMKATWAQARNLFEHYCVKLIEIDNSKETSYDEKAHAPVFTWKVLLRHPDDMRIPSRIGYEKLIVKLMDAYK